MSDALAVIALWASILGMVFIMQGDPDIWDLAQEKVKSELVE
jgi:hypothetical protein